MAFVINGDPSTRWALRPSPGQGKKTEGKGKRHTPAVTPIHSTPGENTHYCHSVTQKCFGRKELFNYTCRFEESFRVQPRENGSIFFVSVLENTLNVFEVALLSRWMFSKEATSTFRLCEEPPWGNCQWHYRRRICVLYEMTEMNTDGSIKGRTRGRPAVCVCSSMEGVWRQRADVGDWWWTSEWRASQAQHL